ncbi:MAG TPA: hypothetical protein VIW24_27475 [Aldersonia sp.]
MNRVTSGSVGEGTSRSPPHHQHGWAQVGKAIGDFAFAVRLGARV